MKLPEYMGKGLLNKYGIPTQRGLVIANADEVKSAAEKLTPPYVLKAQITIGGRGKAGLIKFAQNREEATKVSKEILGMNIKGNIVKKLLVTEKVEIKEEWYLSIILDRESKSPMVMFSPLGGIDVEEKAKSQSGKVARIVINPIIGIKDYISRYIFSKFCIKQEYFKDFNLILKHLYRLFIEYDANLVEINPLVITDNYNLLALDCKIDIDENSLFRHPDIREFREDMDEDMLVKEARRFNFLYIPIMNVGDIAVMSNGSGMLMSCIDLITKSGEKVRVALDLGGGATSDRIAEALKIVFKNVNVRYLFISIFGGITRCDEVARGVKLTMDQNFNDKVVIIRLEGTNKKEALTILDEIREKVIFVETIKEGIDKLKYKRGIN